jgi:hypothetical protein
MIHHLILLDDEADVHVAQGKLINGKSKVAVDVLGSVQCFFSKARWSQAALEALALSAEEFRPFYAAWQHQQEGIKMILPHRKLVRTTL